MTENRSAADSVRLCITLLFAVLPAVVIAVTFVVWHPTLDEHVAAQWDARGRVNLIVAAVPLFVVTQAVAALLAVVGGPVLLLRRATVSTKRQIALWMGNVAGGAAGLWLITAGPTYVAGGAGQAEFNPMLLVCFAVLICYGFVLRAFVPPDRAASTVEAASEGIA